MNKYRVLYAVTALVITALFFALMIVFSPSFETLNSFGFGFICFPVMLLKDVLFCFLWNKPVGRKAMLWISAALALTCAALMVPGARLDRMLYVPFLIEAAVLGINYILCACLKASGRRSACLISALVCLLAAGGYAVYGFKLLICALVPGPMGYAALAGIAIAECGPAVWRLLMLRGCFGKKAAG